MSDVRTTISVLAFFIAGVIRLAAAPPAIGAPIRISQMGPDGNTNYAGYEPRGAYNSTNNEFLIVWTGDNDAGAPYPDLSEWEIYGQILDGNGTEIGTNDFRISNMGPDGLFNFTAVAPAVAYNSVDNEYLVVWMADDNQNGVVDGDAEVFGQLLNAAGQPIGPHDFRISDLGPDGSLQYDALFPAVAYNSVNNQYLVCWEGNDTNQPGLRDDELEIYCQLLDADGNQIGTNDFRITDIGTDSNPNFPVHDVQVAYNSVDNQYLVVFEGTYNVLSFHPVDDDDLEFAIFGQLLDANGAQIGPNDFLIANTGPPDDPLFDSGDPWVAFNPNAGEYLVIFSGETADDGHVNDEFEVFAQIVAANGALSGGPRRISEVGPPGDPSFSSFVPRAAYDPSSDSWLAVWASDDNPPSPLNGADDDFEIHAQRLTAEGIPSPPDNVRVTGFGDNAPNPSAYDSYRPVPIFSEADGRFLVVWVGDDNAGTLADEEYEIYGAFYEFPRNQVRGDWILYE